MVVASGNGSVHLELTLGNFAGDQVVLVLSRDGDKNITLSGVRPGKRFRSCSVAAADLDIKRRCNFLTPLPVDINQLYFIVRVEQILRKEVSELTGTDNYYSSHIHQNTDCRVRAYPFSFLLL